MTARPLSITRNIPLALAAFLTCSLVLACEHDPQPKQRPTDVPLAAVWVGGPDGGSYFDCSIGGPTNECSVWSDSSGETTTHGHFLLDKLNRPATTPEMKFTGTDGTNIFLANGLTLHPVQAPAAAK